MTIKTEVSQLLKVKIKMSQNMKKLKIMSQSPVMLSVRMKLEMSQWMKLELCE